MHGLPVVVCWRPLSVAATSSDLLAHDYAFRILHEMSYEEMLYLESLA